MEKELKGVLEHIRSFLQHLQKSSIEYWSRKGPATSYVFLLVSRPFVSSVQPYIKRVREHLNQGVERIYVMGTNQERRFVKSVISAIRTIPECKLVEIFELNRDYREEKRGIGALFVKGSFEQEANEKIESFFEKGDKN